MKKSSSDIERARLGDMKTAHVEAARRHALAGDLDQASATLAEAALLERLARQDHRRHGPPAFAMTLIGACGLLVFASWKLTSSTFTDLEVSIRGETTAAQLTLARDAALEPVRGAAIDVGRLSALTAQISDVPQRVAGDGWVRVQGSPVEVKGLRAAEGVRLAFALAPAPGKAPTLFLRAYGKRIEGELLVRPGALITAGEADAPAAPGAGLAGDVLDVISFGCDDCAHAPLRVDLREVDPFAFGGIPLSQLELAVERVQLDGTTTFASALLAGSVRLIDTDRVEPIQPGDSLKVEIGKARRFQLGRSANADTFSFVYEGTVKGLSLGPVGAERNLSPSVLESLYRQKALALVWGAGVFMWGLLTGIRKLWQTRSD